MALPVEKIQWLQSELGVYPVVQAIKSGESEGYSHNIGDSGIVGLVSTEDDEILTGWRGWKQLRLPPWKLAVLWDKDPDHRLRLINDPLSLEIIGLEGGDKPAKRIPTCHIKTWPLET